MSPRSVFLSLILALGLLPQGGWAGTAGAGVVMSSAGQVVAVDTQGKERRLEKGAQIFPGDRIKTGEAALVQVKLADGGYLSVRPNAEMKLEKFAFNEKDAASSSFVLSLLKGALRSVTGLIGRSNPAGYEVRTPTATLGVRGTDHEPMFIPEGVPEMAALGPPGTYDKVNSGETFIRNQFGVTYLKPGEIGFSPHKPDAVPQRLLHIPEFYKNKPDLKPVARRDREGKDDAKDDAKGDAPVLRPVGRRDRDGKSDDDGDPPVLKPVGGRSPANRGEGSPPLAKDAPLTVRPVLLAPTLSPLGTETLAPVASPPATTPILTTINPVVLDAASTPALGTTVVPRVTTTPTLNTAVIVPTGGTTTLSPTTTTTTRTLSPATSTILLK